MKATILNKSLLIFLLFVLQAHAGIFDWCGKDNIPDGCNDQTWVPGTPCDTGFMASKPVCSGNNWHCSKAETKESLKTNCCSQCLNPNSCIYFPDYKCKCQCSCLQSDTKVVVAKDGKSVEIQKLKKGTSILTLDTTKNIWTPSQVVEVNVSPIPSNFNAAAIKVSYTLDGTKKNIVCTDDHLFYVYDILVNKNLLVRADELKKNIHQLLDMKFNKLAITEVVAGKMVNGLTSITTSVSTSISGHLFLAEGVIVGDYDLQTHYRGENIGITLDSKTKYTESALTHCNNVLPIGCNDQTAHQGPDCNSGPFAKYRLCDDCARRESVSLIGCSQCLKSGSCVLVPQSNCKCPFLYNHRPEAAIESDVTNAVLSLSRVDASNTNFKSHDHLEKQMWEELPDKISSFLPRFVESYEIPEDQLKPLDHEDILRVGVLAKLFTGYNPKCNLKIHWESNILNAYAWVDDVTNRTNVVMHGGLLRNKALDWEGLSLLFARQYAQINLVRYEEGKWKVCEKSGDINLKGPLMNVFTIAKPGVFWLDFYKKGLEQFKTLFESLPVVDPSDPSFGITSNCSHPTNRINTACRIKIMTKSVGSGVDVSACWKVDAEETPTPLMASLDVNANSVSVTKKHKIPNCSESVCKNRLGASLEKACKKLKKSHVIVPRSVSRHTVCRCQCNK